jgi:hypothetical protein
LNQYPIKTSRVGDSLYDKLRIKHMKAIEFSKLKELIRIERIERNDSNCKYSSRWFVSKRKNIKKSFKNFTRAVFEANCTKNLIILM